jgi:hypothetical protein
MKLPKTWNLPRGALFLCIALSFIILTIGCIEASHFHKHGDEPCKLCILYARLAISLISLAIIISITIAFSFIVFQHTDNKLPDRQFDFIVSRAPPLFN